MCTWKKQNKTEVQNSLVLASILGDLKLVVYVSDWCVSWRKIRNHCVYEKNIFFL